MSLKSLSILLILPLLLASCTTLPFIGGQQETVSTIPQTEHPEFNNPFTPGTYEHFKAEPDYKKTYNVYRNHTVLSSMTPDTARLSINLSTQRAQLLHNDEVAMDYPVATGKSTHVTPTGEFQILEKIKDKRSNTKEKILNAGGVL